MKKLFLILFLFLVSLNTYSQTLISLNISPTDDEAVVDVNIESGTYTTSSFLSQSYTIDNNTITMTVCYAVIGQQVPQNYSHSFPVTVAADGDYTLVLNLYRSGNPDACDFVEFTDTATLNFSTPLTETVYLSAEDFEPVENQLILCPNPVKDDLNIAITGNLNIESIVVYNLLGSKIKTITNSFKTIDLSELSNGIYFLKINTDRGVIDKTIVKGN